MSFASLFALTYRQFLLSNACGLAVRTLLHVTSQIGKRHTFFSPPARRKVNARDGRAKDSNVKASTDACGIRTAGGAKYHVINDVPVQKSRVNHRHHRRTVKRIKKAPGYYLIDKFLDCPTVPTMVTVFCRGILGAPDLFFSVSTSFPNPTNRMPGKGIGAKPGIRERQRRRVGAEARKTRRKNPTRRTALRRVGGEASGFANRPHD